MMALTHDSECDVKGNANASRLRETDEVIGGDDRHNKPFAIEKEVAK